MEFNQINIFTEDKNIYSRTKYLNGKFEYKKKNDIFLVNFVDGKTSFSRV